MNDYQPYPSIPELALAVERGFLSQEEARLIVYSSFRVLRERDNLNPPPIDHKDDSNA